MIETCCYSAPNPTIRYIWPPNKDCACVHASLCVNEYRSQSDVDNRCYIEILIYYVG